MNVVIQSVDDMLKVFWSKLFEDFHEAKMVVLEWDKNRRNIYESEQTWDNILARMYDIEMNDKLSDSERISHLMKICNRHIMWPISKVVKNARMVQLINDTKDKINYYKNNPEEE